MFYHFYTTHKTTPVKAFFLIWFCRLCNKFFLNWHLFAGRRQETIFSNGSGKLIAPLIHYLPLLLTDSRYYHLPLPLGISDFLTICLTSVSASASSMFIRHYTAQYDIFYDTVGCRICLKYYMVHNLTLTMTLSEFICVHIRQLSTRKMLNRGFLITHNMASSWSNDLAKFQVLFSWDGLI